MISDDFKIDFVEKRIYHNPKGSKTIYTVNEFYSYLQDTFDELETMDDDIPMQAKSKTEYLLINGWTIDNNSLLYLTEGNIAIKKQLKKKKSRIVNS